MLEPLEAEREKMRQKIAGPEIVALQQVLKEGFEMFFEYGPTPAQKAYNDDIEILDNIIVAIENYKKSQGLVKKTEEKTFTVYWRYNEKTIIKGLNEADAFRKAGFGGGALKAVDFFATGENSDYTWNSTTKEWDRIVPLFNPTSLEGR